MRIAIFGNSGSGKSVLARHLADELDLPMLDLDTVAWEPGKIAVPADPANAKELVKEFCSEHDAWVVEGCYSILIWATFEWSPNLIFMNPGEEQCIENCGARPFEGHKYKTKEEQDSKLSFLISWVREYYKREDDISLVAHRTRYERYTGSKVEVTENLNFDEPITWLYR